MSQLDVKGKHFAEKTFWMERVDSKVLILLLGALFNGKVMYVTTLS